MSIEIKNISKSYTKGLTVLRPLSFTIRDGEMFFLLGPSGCGKSTLLRIIAGLLDADTGEILLNGVNITKLPPEKRNTPMVFQNYALWPHLDVYENIAFGLRIRKLPSSEIDRRIKEMLSIVKLEDCAKRKIGSLSGGQQQRIALARALALDPALILLDEPLSNLDAKLRDEMRYEIRRICKERGVTALYVTHDRREALSMADRLALLKDGVLQQLGEPHEVYCSPVNRFAASFLGDANFMEGTLETNDGGILTFSTPLGNMKVKSAPGAGMYSTGQQYTLMFRPENTLVEPGSNFTGNRFDAQLTASGFLGESTQRHMKRDHFHFLVNEYGTVIRENGPLRLGIQPDNIVILNG